MDKIDLLGLVFSVLVFTATGNACGEETPQALGEAACENHGFDEAQCRGIGCCIFDPTEEQCFWRVTGAGWTMEEDASLPAAASARPARRKERKLKATKWQFAWKNRNRGFNDLCRRNRLSQHCWRVED